MRRTSETKRQEACKPSKTKDDMPKKKHRAGPLPNTYRGYTQFTNVHCGNLFFSVQNADNCIRVGNDKRLIRNILQKHNSDVYYVLYEPFKRASDFLKYPLPASHLGIFKVSELSGSLRCAVNTSDFPTRSLTLLFLFCISLCSSTSSVWLGEWIKVNWLNMCPWFWTIDVHVHGWLVHICM